MRTRVSAFAAAAALALAVPTLAQPLTTTFTYQGELTDGAAPANGTFDLRFSLFPTSTSGSPLGPTLCVDNIAVVNGRFTVQLDFGAQFAGQQRFLEVLVRPDTGAGCGDASGYTTLAPRTELTAAPNAAFALAAASATSATTAGTATNATQLNGQAASFYTTANNLTGTLPSTLLQGTYTNAVNFSNAGSAYAGNGGNLTGLNASNLSLGTIANVRTTGTALNSPSTLVLRDTSGNFAAGVVTATSFVGFGGNITGLNAGNVTAGTLDNSRTSGTTINASNTLVLRSGSGGFDAGPITATSFSGSGAALTALNASNITTGTLTDARLSLNVPLLNNPNTFLAAQRVDTTSQFPLALVSSSTAGAWLNVRNTSSSGRDWGIVSTGSTSPEGVGKLLIYDDTMNATRLTIDGVGNVGIGVTAPGARLDVAGAIKTSGGITFPDGSTQYRADASSTSPLTTSGLPAGSTFSCTLAGTAATFTDSYTLNRPMALSGGQFVPAGNLTFSQNSFTFRRPRTSDQTWSNWATNNTSVALNMTLTTSGSTVVWSGTMSVRQLRLVAAAGSLFEEVELYPQGGASITRTVTGAPAVSAPSTDAPGATVTLNNTAIANTVLFGSSTGLVAPIDSATGAVAGARNALNVTVRTNPFSAGAFRNNFVNATSQSGAAITSGTTWRSTPSSYVTACTLRLADDGLPIEEYTVLFNN